MVRAVTGYPPNSSDLRPGCFIFFILKVGFHWRRRRCRSRSRSRNHKSASDLVKIENRSRKRSDKLDGIGVGRIRTVPISSDSVYDFDAYDPVKTRLSESEAEANEPITMPISAYDSDNLDHKRRNHKRNGKH